MSDLTDESRPREEGESGLFGRLRGMLGGRNDTDTLRDTIEELIELEEDGAGADNAEELALFRNVLSVRDVAVEDVMVPRADIRAVETATTIADVAKVMSESGHSRLPVYRDRLDDEPRLFELFVEAFEESRPPARQHRAKIRTLIDRSLEEGQSGGAFAQGSREKALTFVLD
ncbi:MAG: hypothetical protein EBU57_00870, partial [Alphaproteobacteria bacterium]|nr:hypothetical protein [Alphaproteobacteria bacterium]